MVVNEVVLRKSGFFSRLRPGYDMIVTDRRFVFANREVAQKGFAAAGEQMATAYSAYQDLDVVAGKERSITIPFIDVRRVRMKIDIPSCNLQIDYADSEGEKKLGVGLPGVPPYIVMKMSKDTVLGMIRDVYGDVPHDVANGSNAASMFYFRELSERLKGALPPSIVLASEWPERRT